MPRGDKVKLSISFLLDYKNTTELLLKGGSQGILKEVSKDNKIMLYRHTSQSLRFLKEDKNSKWRVNNGGHLKS